MSNFGISCVAKNKKPSCDESSLISGGGGGGNGLAGVLAAGNTTADVIVPNGNDIIISGTNQILLNDGTLADPVIAFSADTDAGIFRAGTGEFQITAPDGYIISGASTSALGVTSGDLQITNTAGGSTSITITSLGTDSNAINNVSAGGFIVSAAGIIDIDTTLAATTNAIRLGVESDSGLSVELGAVEAFNVGVNGILVGNGANDRGHIAAQDSSAPGSAAVGNVTVNSVTGSDTAGLVDATTDAMAATDDGVTISFNNAFASPPHVVIAPAGGVGGLNAAQNQLFVSSVTATNFTVSIGAQSPTVNAGGASFFYHVIHGL